MSAVPRMVFGLPRTPAQLLCLLRAPAVGTAAALLVGLACGGEDAPPVIAPEEIQRVTAAARPLAIEDLVGAGCKSSKQYDVTGLIEARSAYYGFYRPGGGAPISYEARFYDTHEAAIEFGTALAEEGAGEGAKLSRGTAIWKEGLSERRLGTGYMGSGLIPKYGDYVIYGNMVLLCEGVNSEEALLRCASLIGAVEGTAP